MLKNYIIPLIEELLPSTLMAGFVVLIFRNWISIRLKSAIQNEYDEKLQTLKSSLDAQNSANLEILRNDLVLKTKLIEIEKTWIHQRTAEALLVLHEETNASLRIIRKYVSLAQGPEYTNPANIIPVNCLEKNRILIPDSLVESIESFATKLEHQAARFKCEVVSAAPTNYEAHEKWLDIDRIVNEDSKLLLRNLEKEFKRIIGVHPTGF